MYAVSLYAEVIVGSIGGLLVAAGAVVSSFYVYKRCRRSPQPEAYEDDENPVYATYAVHHDPVAEVATTYNRFS